MSREYKKQMLLKREKDGKVEIFRVLDVLENILVINCVKRSMPVWKTTEELSEYVEMEEQKEEKILSPKQEQEANRIYNIISPVIPFISNESLRTDSIKEVAKRYDVSEQFVRKYLSIYLAANNISSLAPKTRNEGRELTRDEKNIRKSLNKWYYTTKKRTLKNCYTLMLENYYCDEKGKLLEEYPSYYQFRYFYRKYNKPSTEMISRNTLSYYQRNQRPLVGDGVQGFAGTIGMGMLDATVCDIYLVNESGELVGRPIFTSCVDAFTGLVCGYALSLEVSLFEYLEERLNPDCKSVLSEQYRMNPVIGDLISEMFYDKGLVSKTLKEKKTIPLEMYEHKPLVWLSTSNNSEKKEQHIGDTYRNTCEANIIFEQLLQIDEELQEKKLHKEAAIIAGYRGQRDVLNRLWESKYAARFHNMTVEINTVDAFQGRETDIVFYSVVRSNDKGSLGFLKDVRRLNVAFSRARELLVVVGDHNCAQRQTEINGQRNPFVGIIGYIYNHDEDCLMKEV